MRGVRLGAIAGLLLVGALAAYGQSSATGQLTISAVVQPTISLTFASTGPTASPGNCLLLNSGTSNVGLDLGAASFTNGTTSPCATFAAGVPSTQWYQVSSAFNVVVSKSNTASPTYSLTAQLSTAPPANTVNWLIDGTTLNAATATSLSTAAAYGTTNRTLQVQVKKSLTGQTLQETITFIATAN